MATMQQRHGCLGQTTYDDLEDRAIGAAGNDGFYAKWAHEGGGSRGVEGALCYGLPQHRFGLTHGGGKPNASGELWGLERLERLLRSCSRMAPNEIVERILAEESEFANGEPQRHDVTLVVMKVQKECEI